MKIVELVGTTDAAGDLSVTSTKRFTGFIEKLIWVNTAAAATADITVTAEAEMSEPVITITDQAQADTAYYPRTPANAVADASAFTNWGDKIFISGAQIKMVVAQGGASKGVRALVFVSDE